MVLTRAVVSGSFKRRPSVIAPYHEARREHYAPSLALRVDNPFGIETPFDGHARPRRR